MIGYVTIGTTDMEKAKAFWTELLEPLGAKVLMDIGRIAFVGEAMDKPILALCTPFDEQAPHRGNGNMLAFPAGSRERVDELHARAMSRPRRGRPGRTHARLLWRLFQGSRREQGRLLPDGLIV